MIWSTSAVSAGHRLNGRTAIVAVEMDFGFQIPSPMWIVATAKGVEDSGSASHVRRGPK